MRVDLGCSFSPDSRQTVDKRIEFISREVYVGIPPLPLPPPPCIVVESNSVHVLCVPLLACNVAECFSNALCRKRTETTMTEMEAQMQEKREKVYISTSDGKTPQYLVRMLPLSLVGT